MRRIRLLILLPLITGSFVNIVFSQDSPTLIAGQPEKVEKITNLYISAVGEKSEHVSKQINKSTFFYIEKLQRQEAKLQKRVAKIDSLAAHNIFANSANKYQQLKADVKSRTDKLQHSTGLYLPWNDTASASLKFLASNPLTGKLPINSPKLNDALIKVINLEKQFKQSENIKDFITQRKEYLKQRLANFDVGSDLKHYNSTAYYYSQQLKDYKESLKDESRAEQKALTLLRKIPAFSDFMQKYGALAGLFDVPANYGSANLNRLQTISQVQNILQSRISGMGSNAIQTVQANLASAQSELSKLRNRFDGLGNTADIPDFSPNPNKTKPFKKRLLFGFDMTTVRNSTLFPLTTDFGLSVGYKMSGNFTAGVGISYKQGWGSDLHHISLSSQGMSLRSNVDWKIKKNIYLSGGMELNYLSSINNIKILQDYTAWQKSALLGVSKTVSLKSKNLSATKVSLLYDFLHAMQVPRTQAVVFRVGYVFH